MRYKHLTYMYSALYVAHARGGMALKPLSFVQPGSAAARSAVQQWLVGDALLVSPALHPDVDAIDAHFTAGTWYDAWDYSRLADVPVGGGLVHLPMPLGEIGLHYRGGSIVPIQRYAPATRDVRYSAVTLVIALPDAADAAAAVNGSAASAGALPPYAAEPACVAARATAAAGSRTACGLLFMDSEDDPLALGPSNSLLTWFTAAASADGREGALRASPEAAGGPAASQLRVEAVHVLGVSPGAAMTMAEASRPATAAVNGAALPSSRIAYDARSGVLKLTGLDMPLAADASISWSLY
jgi:Glycosyl hydrolases family 31